MGLFGPSKNEKKLQAEIERLQNLLLPEQRDIEKLNVEINESRKTVELLESQIAESNNTLAKLEEQKANLDLQIKDKQRQVFSLNLDVNMQEFGVYKPTYDFANSDLYKERLNKTRDMQKQMIKDGTACAGNMNWSVNGSTSKGQIMVRDMQKLLLRAYNVECDDVVANVRISNFDKCKERIMKLKDQISKLGSVMSIFITDKYAKLKMDELCLALDFQQKKQEEKELQKELRAQEREEAKAMKELEEERKRLKKEQTHYENALKTVLLQIEKNGETAELLDKKRQLESQITEINSSIETVDYRTANQKAGYVYIISNIGAFGENIYKIGMTRRLDPQERVDELGDASVPFNFDVHAIIFTEDAPRLEAALHNAFESKKLNKINTRREFFAVSLDEIKLEVRKNFDKTVEWIDVPEAEQYRQSISLSK